MVSLINVLVNTIKGIFARRKSRESQAHVRIGWEPNANWRPVITEDGLFDPMITTGPVTMMRRGWSKPIEIDIVSQSPWFNVDGLFWFKEKGK